MSSLDKEQQLQEKLYTFPYHHIPQYEGRTFSQTRALPWGYQYISYIYFILSKIEKLQFNSLLDVGCGDGKFLVEVSKAFPSIKLVGVDFSERAIGYAKAFNPNIEFLCGDITDPSLIDEKFHIVTIIETLEHISPTELPKFVKGLHNCLKDDGTLVLTVPSTNSPLRGKHFQHFSAESLEKILNPYFSIREKFFINRITRWETIIRWLLYNRFFILNQRRIVNSLFKIYNNFLLHGDRKNTMRICAICDRNNMV